MLSVNVKATHIQLQMATEGKLYVLADVANRIEDCKFAIKSYVAATSMYNYRFTFVAGSPVATEQPFDVDMAHTVFAAPQADLETVPVMYRLTHPTELVVPLLVPSWWPNEPDDIKREYANDDLFALLDKYLPVDVEVWFEN